MKKKKEVWIGLDISISHRKHFTSRADLVAFLGIKNTSKKAIEARCRKFNYTVDFNDY